METDTIGGLARAGGVGVETVRYYQRRGLLRTPARGDGVRRYGAEDARRLLALDSGRDHVRARELARGRIRDLDARIAELTAARAALSRLADACDHADGPCPIIKAFEGG